MLSPAPQTPTNKCNKTKKIVIQILPLQMRSNREWSSVSIAMFRFTLSRTTAVSWTLQAFRTWMQMRTLSKRHQYPSFRLWRRLTRNRRLLSRRIRSLERIRCRICNRALGRKWSVLQWMKDLSSHLRLPLLAEKIIKRKRRKEEIRPTSTSESRKHPPQIWTTTTRWMIWAGVSWEVSQRGTTSLIQTSLWTIKAQICTWEIKIRLAKLIHSNSSKMRTVQLISKVSQTQWTAFCQIQATARKITC